MVDREAQSAGGVACCINGVLIGDWNKVFFAGKWVLPFLDREIESRGGILSVTVRVSDDVSAGQRRLISRLADGGIIEVHGAGRLFRRNYLVGSNINPYEVVLVRIDRLAFLSPKDLRLLLAAGD